MNLARIDYSNRFWLPDVLLLSLLTINYFLH